MKIRTKLIGTIVVGAALLAPVAQARPDDQAGARGPGAIASTQGSAATHPDNQEGTRGPGAVAGHEASVRPDDRAGARGPGAVTPAAYRGMLPSDYGLPNVVVADVSRPDGFDWGDALIGVLGGAGTALILTGSGFLLLSQRNKARTAQA
jgi:hypothetical protein